MDKTKNQQDYNTPPPIWSHLNNKQHCSNENKMQKHNKRICVAKRKRKKSNKSTTQQKEHLGNTKHHIQFFKNYTLFLSFYFGQCLCSCVFFYFSFVLLFTSAIHFFGLCLKSFQSLFFDFDSFFDVF